MTEVPKAHQTLLVKSPSRAANRRRCTNFKRGSCQQGDSCDYWRHDGWREREKLATKGEVTSAASGSRNPEMDAEHWSAEVAPAIKEVMREVSLIKEKSQQFEEVASRKGAASTEAEGGSEMCETEGEQQPVRVKAPPQKGRAVIRVESAETQDYVSEDREPQRALHLCDKKCREESIKLFQVAAIVTEEGRTAHTIDLCKECFNERRLKQGEQPVRGRTVER